MDDFNATKYFEKVKSKVIDDQNMLDTINELEKAWDKEDKTEVKTLSESLCRNIPKSVITDAQRKVLVDMGKGALKPKKNNKKKKMKMTQKLKGMTKFDTSSEDEFCKWEKKREANGVTRVPKDPLEEETEPTVDVERTGEHLEASGVANVPQDQLEEEQTEPTVDVERTDKHIIAELEKKIKSQEIILERYKSVLLDENSKNSSLSERLSNLKSEKSVREKELEGEILRKVLTRQIETLKVNKKQSEREKELEDEIEVLKRETETLKADRRQSKKENELKKENKVQAREIETLKAEKEKALSKSKPKLKEVKNQQLDKDNKEMKRMIKEISEENEQLKTENAFHQSSIRNLKERLRGNDISLQRSKTSLDESNKKIDQLVTRLSKVAGTKLMHNNPNIADLSDKDRPTKLAEKYSELYDNEYTDAFTALNEAQTRTDEDIVTYLLEILLDCFVVCMEKSNDQMVYMKSILLFPSTVELKNPEEIPLTEEQEKMVTDLRKQTSKITHKDLFRNLEENPLTEEQEKMITDLRKQTAEITHKDLFQVLKARHKKPASMPQDLVKYIGCCTELCWKMVVQTPPLYLGVTDSKHESFNKDVYKPYTKMGKRIRFVVWPPLYLHEHGAILCKGTAQGGD